MKLANYLEWELQDYNETVNAALAAYGEVKAGRTRQPQNFSNSYARSMACRVEITPQAEQDANDIFEWLLSQQAG